MPIPLAFQPVRLGVSMKSVQKESRSFLPHSEFQALANWGDATAYDLTWDAAQKDPIAYWEEAASSLHWDQAWTKPMEGKFPWVKWFVGAKLNASYNCLDRHLATHRNRPAIIWEGEDGRSETWTFGKLFEETCRLANALERMGLKSGDTAAIYMPLVPQAAVAMLACARIGVTHNIVFGGFSSHALRDRIVDAKCRVVFTADFGYRRGDKIGLGSIVAEATKDLDVVEKIFVMKREATSSLMERGVWWSETVSQESAVHKAKPFDSEHPLFVLYTSGTTGKPKGIVHSTGGYLVGATVTAKAVLDLKADDIYWCTADVGWITGHSYVVYGILANGNTTVMYEGAPIHPHAGRIWEVIEKHKVTILYTAPTAIRTFMRLGDDIPAKYPMKSLRLLGSVGEPINPEAWVWYYEKIGKGRCPIVDTWWQTETGAIMISPVPGVTKAKPGSATKPFFGIQAEIVDEAGNPCGPNQGGLLVINHPWPSMARTIQGDPARFEEQYFKKFTGRYFTGDGARKDADGFFWIMGRVDDVINVSGHRLGTAEIESALVSHPVVAEAAVVARPDEMKGQVIVAYVTPKDLAHAMDLKQLREALKKHVVAEIGALARPEDIFFTKTLPKTRSGKIMRRLLKDLAAGKTTTGDTSTLENPGLVELLTE